MKDRNETKNCWKCGRPVEINKYGYGYCPPEYNPDGYGAYSYTDSRHFVVIQSNGKEVQL